MKNVRPYPYSSFKEGLEFVIAEYNKDTKRDASFQHNAAWKMFREWLDGVIARMKECPKCDGTGHPFNKMKGLPFLDNFRNPDKKCKQCAGTGYVIGDLK